MISDPQTVSSLTSTDSWPLWLVAACVMAITVSVVCICASVQEIRRAYRESTQLVCSVQTPVVVHDVQRDDPIISMDSDSVMVPTGDGGIVLVPTPASAPGHQR